MSSFTITGLQEVLLNQLSAEFVGRGRKSCKLGWWADRAASERRLWAPAWPAGFVSHRNACLWLLFLLITKIIHACSGTWGMLEHKRRSDYSS
jgi:hypothetical protein